MINLIFNAAFSHRIAVVLTLPLRYNKLKIMVKILVPTDFSTEATYALDVAHEIALQHNQAQFSICVWMIQRLKR
jgi:hypothetical protein